MPKQMPKSAKKVSHRKRTVWLSILIVLVLGGAGVAAYIAQRQANAPVKPIASKTTGGPKVPNIKVPTHTAQANGETVQVPNNVSSDSIKNYTLITQNSDYEIQELDGAYTITLYAIINNPSQASSYKQQLHTFKQEALDYLTQHGVNVNTAKITYDPSEAAQY